MEIKHTEIKDDAQYTYPTLRKERAQPLHDVFYEFLEDYICSIHVTHTFTEKASVYISFAITLINNNEDHYFFKNELYKTTRNINKEEIKNEIGAEEFHELEKDLNVILCNKKNKDR